MLKFFIWMSLSYLQNYSSVILVNWQIDPKTHFNSCFHIFLRCREFHNISSDLKFGSVQEHIWSCNVALSISCSYVFICPHDLNVTQSKFLTSFICNRRERKSVGSLQAWATNSYKLVYIWTPIVNKYEFLYIRSNANQHRLL